MDIETELDKLCNNKKITWKKTTREGLDVDYSVVFPRVLADAVFKQLENVVEYESPEKSKVFFK